MNRNKAIDIDFLVNGPLLELLSCANKVRADHLGDGFELCNILNAKSGLCSEDCKFCAQSVSHSCEISTHPLKSENEMLQAAQQAKELGADKFGIVTSGNRLNETELAVIVRAVSRIKAELGIAVCASLGSLEKSALFELKAAGLTRYHHNIETSARFYKQIVSTHAFEERIATITAAKQVGLEVCSGGIVGMGENWQDRIDMAQLLEELDVDSVPINLLVPIKSTQLESAEPISCVDAIRTVCIFRIILADKIIKIAAGRETVLKDFQAMAFMAGANGMLIGGYLTVKGRKPAEDRRLVEEVTRLWRQ